MLTRCLTVSVAISLQKIPGATSSAYALSPVHVSDSGSTFQCRAANAIGTSNSVTATLTVTADTILVRDNEPMPTTVDEEVVVLSVRAGAYFGFNRIGTEIWNMLAEPRRVGEILDTLAQSHEVDLDTMTRDVTQFLQTLIERRLVRVVDSKESR